MLQLLQEQQIKYFYLEELTQLQHEEILVGYQLVLLLNLVVPQLEVQPNQYTYLLVLQQSVLPTQVVLPLPLTEQAKVLPRQVSMLLLVVVRLIKFSLRVVITPLHPGLTKVTFLLELRVNLGVLLLVVLQCPFT